MMVSKIKNNKTLVLLDAHAIIHRAYHALPDFSSSKGEPTGALYGIVAMLVNILNDIRPEYIAACFDLPKPTFRHEVFKDYKGSRKKSDDALVEQIIRSRDIFKAFNIPIYELEGYEADDLLGTIVEQLTNKKQTPKQGFGVDIVIASGDMDTMQLVDGKRVQVYTLKKGVRDTIIYDETAVIERFKFVPELLPDYKGLRGDPSDNIPGIKGIGEKTATTLISTFGDLDNTYKALDGLDATNKEELKRAGLTPRTLSLLQEGKDEAYFSKMLATIKKDAEINYELPKESWLPSVNREEVFKLLQELELRTLVNRVKSLLINGDDAEGEEIVSEASELEAEREVSQEEVKQVSLMLWLINSDITNPTLDDVLQFTGETNFNKAKEHIKTVLKDRRLESVYTDIEAPLIAIIKEMNKVGIKLDTGYLTKLSKEYHKELNKIEKEIFKLAGVEFNIRSPKQLGEVLFDKMGLITKKKTASGQYSTNEKELKKLAKDNPIINLIFEYRELQKLLSTYIDNLPKMLADDGRLHAQFLQAGTTTGRMASQNPNMQNIPTKSEYGMRVRKGFIAQKGNILVALDYSQIELRCVAVLSKDKKLMEIFNSGGDIHNSVACEVFDVRPNEVTPEMRRRAKVINFGILYGMGVNALRESLQEGSDEVVTTKQAREYLNKYFESFSGLAGWIDDTKTNAARLGYTETLFGRKRYFDGLTSKLPFIRAAAERMAVNAPVQGTSADITKLAMIATDKYIKEHKLERKVRLLLQVHDELIYEIFGSIDDGDILEHVKALKNIMESVAKFNIPIDVDVKIGNNWAEMNKLDV
ncbi:MAG: DNA polymerase [Candidatus Pacebacteria bacterium]|nr:DNA polymerase [Candidatus Paceibacterota bacterium]